MKAIRLLARKLGVSPEYLEYGVDVDPRERREIDLIEAELELRMGEVSTATERRLTVLIEQSEREGDRPLALRARCDLALAVLELGDERRAGEEIDNLLACDGLSPSSDSTCAVFFARALTRLGRKGEALALLEDALDNAVSDGNGGGIAAVNAARVASALAQIAERSEAERALTRAGALIEAGADPRERVSAYRRQAQAAAKAHDLRAALQAARKAAGLADELDDRRQLALAHLLYAKLLVASDRLDEADEKLANGETMLGPGARREDVTLLKVLQARVAARRGDGATARAVAAEAVGLGGECKGHELGLAHWALAEAYVAGGEPKEGESEIGRALSLLRAEAPAEAAELLRWWAHVLREQGRGDEAFAALEEALTLSEA